MTSLPSSARGSVRLWISVACVQPSFSVASTSAPFTPREVNPTFSSSWSSPASSSSSSSSSPLSSLSSSSPLAVSSSPLELSPLPIAPQEKKQAEINKGEPIMRLQLCVILLACATCPPLALALVGGINLREGRPADLPIIQATLARNLMNFIALTPRHFIVAESKASNELVGWGQVKPVVEGRTYELSGLYVNEAERGRGVGASIVKQLLQKHRNQHGS
ncbi:unnamed protein product, partial [Chrysoparadoxa australica]